MLGPISSALEAAERAVVLAAADPRAALLLTEDVLGRDERDPESVVVARRAAALAELELGRAQIARELLEEALSLAVDGQLLARASEVARSRAFLLLQLEEPDAALASVDAAITMAPNWSTRAPAQAQRAVILMRLGRYAEALQESERALPNLRPSGLETQLAYLRSNRGLVWAYLGDFDRAETELNLALELHRRQGSELSAAQVVNNLGFVASMRGTSTSR
jgi:tetratricopeptide (TPR) repeat protein